MVVKKEHGVAVALQRRQWTRLTVAIPMFVRGTDQQGKHYLDFATALNISVGGCLMLLHRELPMGAEVALEIPIGQVPQVVAPRLVRYLQGRLLRSEPTEKCFLVAVEFANPLSF